MLSLLHIENVAVIEEADISFDAGLNVLTGETGAGKSIVIDAISAVLGERTHRDLIRTGCDKASVSAIFMSLPPLSWFETHQIPFDSSEALIQREIFTDGRNICRVNGKLVTVSILHDLGLQLINIHGQNDTQTLFNEDTHLEFLDIFAEDIDIFHLYTEKFKYFDTLSNEVRRLSINESERLRRMETLQYQINEISGAELRAGEDDELKSRRKLLVHAERLSDGLSGVVQALYGDDDTPGAVDLLDRSEKELNRLCAFSDRYEALAKQLTELRLGVQDCAEELRNELDALAYSGDVLEQIEDRLDVIGRLCKKYGETAEDVLAYAENASLELSEIENADSKLEMLKEKLSQAEKAAMDAAIVLRERRMEAAVRLRCRLEDELSQLDMPNIRFAAQFEETALQANGMDCVRFLMSANLGEALKPLSKVASGGELARIMLAMKNVLAELDRIPTLIFDEVDTGVSGRAAQKVAEKLLAVSRGKQVLCVTHLPQIAAMADSHLLIQKAVRDGRTYTSVKKLEREGRISELARIIGGADITENTKRSAEDMLRTSI